MNSSYLVELLDISRNAYLETTRRCANLSSLSRIMVSKSRGIESPGLAAGGTITSLNRTQPHKYSVTQLNRHSCSLICRPFAYCADKLATCVYTSMLASQS